MHPLVFLLLAFIAILACAVVGSLFGMTAFIYVACALFALWYVVRGVAQRKRTRKQATVQNKPVAMTEEWVADRKDVSPPDDRTLATADEPPKQEQAESKEEEGQEESLDDPPPRTIDEKQEEKTSPENEGPAVPDDPIATDAQASEDPSFDYDDFCRSLLLSAKPLSYLRSITKEARDCRKNGIELHHAKSFLARLLDEAGIDEKDVFEEFAHIDVVRPQRSGLFYIRTAPARVTYDAMLHILRVEAALNALVFAHEYYSDLDGVGIQDMYRAWQRTSSSICAQVPDVDTADWSYLAMPWQMPFGPSDQGEWSVRMAISEAIESVRVPYRLEARFRCNVSSGDVALEFKMTPAAVFARSAHVDGIGIVPTTKQMRAREATAYAARVAILLANHAFRSSPKIRRVWIAAVEETPSSHACLFSAQIERRAFSHLRMASIANPLESLSLLGASFDEENDVLRPTTSCFYLEDERFCPRFRHDIWSLSERTLPASVSHSLGARRISELHIHEELPRTLAADKVLRELDFSTPKHSAQQSVKAIMNVAQDTSDFSVWRAAERTALKLVEGKLSPGEPEAIRQEMIAGDELTRMLERAQSLLMHQNPHEALRVIDQAINPLERNGTYADTEAVAYRSFESFTERVVYNRLNAKDGRSVILVPDAYLLAHLVASAILLSLPNENGGDSQLALAHARRALDIAPLNGSAHLGMAACLEAVGDQHGAAKQIKDYLQVAYHPQGMALAYYRLAPLEWGLGGQRECMACYQQAVRLFPPLLPFAISEYHALCNEQGGNAIELLDETQLEEALRQGGIPVAPTPRTAFILYDGATASVDAEVFPVARELMRVLEALSGDDVLRGIRASLENEPDE